MDENSEIIELLKVLSKTFSCTTTSQIKEAEEKLKQFDQLIINKISKIFELFTLDEIPLPNKKSLAIRVKYIFDSYGKSKNIKLNDLLQYIELLINNFIEIKNLKCIHTSIIDQICETLKILLNNKLLKNNEELLIKLSQSIIGKININNSFIIFSFLYLIVLSPNTNIKNINGIINQNFINAIKNYIMSKNNINQTIKILDLLSLSLKKLLYLGQAEYIINSIINNLFEILYRALIDYSYGENSFMSLVNKNLKDDEEYIRQKAKVNLLKSKIFLVIGFMIECDLSIKNENKLQNIGLIQGLMKIIKVIFSSLDYIIKEVLSDLEIYYKTANYEIIIYQAFSLINKCISVSPFKEDFSSVAKNFIFFKIIPFFTLDLGEIELFKESPDEYYLQVIDTMTEFNFKKIKTVCGKCLTLICENYPNISFVVLNTIFEILIFHMEEFGRRRNLDKYTLINNEIGEFVIDNYRNESVISISLLCISILAKQAMINSELKSSLHKFLLDNQMRLENVDSDKIRFELCLLYGLFLDELFDVNKKEDKEFITISINFLLSIIIYSNKMKIKNALSYQAFHSFEQILDNKGFCEITNELVKKYYQPILEAIIDCNLIIFLDMINLFIQKIEVMRENIVEITNNILKKLKKDLIIIKSVNDQDANFSNFVNKEMDIIANIIINFNIEEIETKVCEFIIDFIKNIGSHEFVEKIIYLIVNYSKKKDKSNLINQMINDSSQIIQGYYKSSYFIDFYSFKIINYLIITNSQENENIILLMKNVVGDSLQKIEDNFYGQENIIYTLLLIICWLISKNNDIDNNEINNIVIYNISLVLDKLIKLLEKDKNGFDADNNYIKYFYIVIIITSFIFYSKYTFPIIYDKNLFNTLLKCINDIIIINNSLFSLNINRLLIFGLSKILYENDYLKMIIVYFKETFIINYNLISKQLSEETKILKNINNLNHLKDSENDEIDNNNNYLVKKINDIIKELTLPKLNFDEFEIFNELYKKITGNNATKDAIQEVVGKMDDNAKKDLENILKVKKVKIPKVNNQGMIDENDEIIVHRIILSIKKGSM